MEFKVLGSKLEVCLLLSAGYGPNAIYFFFSVEKFVDRLLTREAEEQPSDNVKPEELVMELPPWYDEELFKK